MLYKTYVLIILFSLVVSENVDRRQKCGCVETMSLNPRDVVAWTLFPADESSKVAAAAKCDSFCQGEAKHFTLSRWRGEKYSKTGRILCRCYRSLPTFDCHEEIGVALVPVHCKTKEKENNKDNKVDPTNSPNHANQTLDANEDGNDTLDPWLEESPRDVMAAIRNGLADPRLFQSREDRAQVDLPPSEIDYRPGLPISFFDSDSDDENDALSSDRQSTILSKKKEALGLTAVILGLLAVGSVTTMAVVTWIGHRKRRDEEDEDIEMETKKNRKVRFAKEAEAIEGADIHDEKELKSNNVEE